jgi:hypothetical protein
MAWRLEAEFYYDETSKVWPHNTICQVIAWFAPRLLMYFSKTVIFQSALLSKVGKRISKIGTFRTDTNSPSVTGLYRLPASSLQRLFPEVGSEGSLGTLHWVKSANNKIRTRKG